MSATKDQLLIEERFRLMARDAWANRTAVVSGSNSLTYAALADAVDRLAAELRSLGVADEAPVVSYLRSSACVPVALLSIWRAGGAYVPIDPDVPDARNSQILHDCRPAALVLEEGSKPSLDLSGLPVVEINSQGIAVNCGPPPHVDTVPVRPDQLAYIIYTSGSTGRPKGVLVEHASLCALALSHERILYAQFEPPIERVSVNNPLTTDASLSELVNVAYGRSLHLVDSKTRQHPDRMADYLVRHDVEVLDATPAQIRMLIMAGHLSVLRKLRLLLLGGEAIDPELWTCLRAAGQVTVVNLYGPTECTVDVTYAHLNRYESPTIGTDLPGCTVYLLNEELELVPDGDVGEICVSGVQVARGYLNAPIRTREQFVEIALGSGPPFRIYRTGDLARRSRDGTLEYLGRTDDQVQVNGNRVELSDIEAAVRRCPGVLDTAVALAGTGADDALLCAFVVLDDGFTEAGVQRHVSGELPAAIVPLVTATHSIPRTSDGKVDRHALLELG